jgi:hypothetical protein
LRTSRLDKWSHETGGQQQWVNIKWPAKAPAASTENPHACAFRPSSSSVMLKLRVSCNRRPRLRNHPTLLRAVDKAIVFLVSPQRQCHSSGEFATFHSLQHPRSRDIVQELPTPPRSGIERAHEALVMATASTIKPLRDHTAQQSDLAPLSYAIVQKEKRRDAIIQPPSTRGEAVSFYYKAGTRATMSFHYLLHVADAGTKAPSIPRE